MCRREGSSRSAVDEEAQRPDGQSRLPRFAFMGYSAEAGPGPDTSLRRVVDTPRVSPGADTNDRRMPESDVRRVVTSLRSPLVGKRTQEEAADPVQAGLISDVDARPLYEL
jgi:hypothetical protein